MIGGGCNADGPRLGEEAHAAVRRERRDRTHRRELPLQLNGGQVTAVVPVALAALAALAVARRLGAGLVPTSSSSAATTSSAAASTFDGVAGNAKEGPAVVEDHVDGPARRPRHQHRREEPLD